jgi:broad specificity phosphatase PhoE
MNLSAAAESECAGVRPAKAPVGDGSPGLGDVGGAIAIARFCLVENQNSGVLAAVATLVGEQRLNIVGNTCKARGALSFQVLDIEVPAAELRCVETALLEQLKKVPGVLQVSINSFSRESGEIYVENAPMRLCVVTDNVPGTLGRLAMLLGVTLGLRILSQVNRSRGALAYNVFDVENTVGTDWGFVCQEVETVKEVRSCSIGHFINVPGGSPKRLSMAGSVASFLSIDEQIGAESDAETEQQLEFRPPASARAGFTAVPDLLPPTHSTATIFDRIERGLRSQGGSGSIPEEHEHERERDTSPPRAPQQGQPRLLSLARAHVATPQTKSVAAPAPAAPAPAAPTVAPAVQLAVPSPDAAWETEAAPAHRVSALGERSSSVASSSSSYYDGDAGVPGERRARKLTLMSERGALTIDAAKLVLVMVGLPARGKSFSARKLKRFLNWRNSAAQIFNAGRYRRERVVSKGCDEERLHASSTESQQQQQQPGHKSSSSQTDRADFFAADNAEGRKMREEAAGQALEDLLKFLRDGGQVGIFDATNSTRARRQWIIERCRGFASVVFIEVICDDEEILRENLLAKIRTSPDYAGMDEHDALEDLRSRIANYASLYTTISDADASYIKIYNMSTKIMANKVYGRTARSLLPYMLSLHVGLRPIWFVRAGMSEDSRVAADPEQNDLLDPSTESKSARLNHQGRHFARRLALWIQTAVWLRDGNDLPDGETLVENEVLNIDNDGTPRKESLLARALHAPGDGGASGAVRGGGTGGKSTKGTSTPPNSFAPHEAEMAMSTGGAISVEQQPMQVNEVVRRTDGERQAGALIKVLSSTLPRAEETAQIALSQLDELNVVEPGSMLNPLDKGELAGLSMLEIQEKHARFYDEWIKDTYRRRFPGGESYQDLVTRLEPVLIEIEQQTAPVLVVSHVSCIQVLLAYYLGCPVAEAMQIKVPMHKVIEVVPTAGGSFTVSFHSV